MPLFIPVPPKVDDMTPDKAALPSKGKSKMVLGVDRVVAVFDVRAVVAKEAEIAVDAELADKAVVA